ncbi:hypothetical protein [Nocardia aobensis]|uniref:hypothetical protein n=1 Tax=Nocardia aobensis TaxID=257277 RepID=UPI001576C824|nr:hypothetical protein [Nocardia aobensis]
MEAFALGAEDAEEFDRAGVGVAEPVREVSVELGDLAVGGKRVIAAGGLRVYTPRFRSQNCSGW